MDISCAKYYFAKGVWHRKFPRLELVKHPLSHRIVKKTLNMPFIYMLDVKATKQLMQLCLILFLPYMKECLVASIVLFKFNIA